MLGLYGYYESLLSFFVLKLKHGIRNPRNSVAYPLQL